MWMGVGRTKQSWDCSKYCLTVLSHLLPNAEHAGSLSTSAGAEQARCCSESKALCNPGAVVAVLSYLMLCLAMSLQEPALLCPWNPSPELSHRAVLNGQPQCLGKPWLQSPGALRLLRSRGKICSSDFSLHLTVLGLILGEQSSRTDFPSHGDTSGLISPPDCFLLPFF